ncbi:MAG: acyl-ACP--UDP-N-acetylglucosamine O-acyltransferase [Verrucomicrobiota bacterium]|nr:MAG: acyl-ACP--UDP-N-acetylglucosamine O-acyltransferase [Verrucomicrobiota bacterium]
MTQIHPTAVISSGAELTDDVAIGAFAYIGPEVTIGSGTIVHHHASVDGNTSVGEKNTIFPYAMIGGQTQDLKYKGGSPGLYIGDRNIFREYVTIHTATEEGNCTRVGNDNAILAYAHVAHDCVIGNHVVISSLSALAGHVVLGNYVNIAWNAGVHQFCHIGDYAMLAGSSKAVMDILPFMIAEGLPARTRAFNKIALERNGFSPERIDTVKDIFRVIFHSRGNRAMAFETLRRQETQDPELYQLVLGGIQRAQRGFC